ncbi:MAG: glycosyltransferase [Gaiellaceae bacterium]
MRILHVTPELPMFPGGSGGATRQFHLLRRLAERDNEITVVAPVTSEQAARVSELEAFDIRVRAVPRPTPRVVEALRALARRPSLVGSARPLPVLAWQAAVFWTYLAPVARRAVADTRPELVSFEHDHAAAWEVDVDASIPRVLTLQNVGWSYYERRAHAAHGLRRALFGAEARRFRRYGERVLPRFDLLVAVSESDRSEISQLLPAATEVIPNGVSTRAFMPLPHESEGDGLLFTGTLSHPPNEEGILWFVREVWARIVEARPETTLTIVGRDPPRTVHALASEPGIRVVGSVPDVTPFFRDAAVALVPLLSGGGTRLKLLEALAFSRATVSTRVGAEGLDVQHGRQVVLADSPDDFARATLALLADRPRRIELATAGRELVERTYDWDAIGDRYDSVLRGLVGR